MQNSGNISVLVTGAAGFIGFHVSKRLLARGHKIVGVDCLSAYYDVALKERRIAELRKSGDFHFEKLDLAELAATTELFARERVDCVIHLAAQAGVRHSLVAPRDYIDANIAGFLNVLEGCRHNRCRHLIYASSSSVYGGNSKMPFSVHDNVDHPLSLYGATKKANELMAHAYSHLFGLPTTGLRFFTVYGPWGRPDMAMWLFAEAITSGKPIKLFNYGNMKRDFTYVDDVIDAIERLIDKPPQKTNASSSLDPATSSAPWRVYNIGNNKAIQVSYVVDLLQEQLGRKANAELLPMQPGDVPETCANVDDLMRDVGFRPSTSIEEGVRRFVAWFREYHFV